ncbi:MAG: hypothetical protein H0T79_18085 [Deltaproteobacteria bacterium]|nr:hypothetical protein [Deltaproteobacteria bacterium]
MPKTRERIRRTTREGLGHVGIESAVENYLQGAATSDSTGPTAPPKR